MSFLPKIIFLESHADPTVKKVLIRLIPFLKHLDYEVYYDEYSVGENLEKALFFWQLESAGDMLRRELKIGKISTPKKEDCNLANVSFLENLQESQIEYKAIDRTIPYGTEEEIRIYAKSDQGMRERDLNFSNKYVNEERGVFGVLGLAHTPGFQGNLLKVVPKDKISLSYCFIHIVDPLDAAESEEKFNEINASLPLKSFVVNESSRDVKSIVRAIAVQILKQHVLLYCEFFKTKEEKFQSEYSEAAKAAKELRSSINKAIINHLDSGNLKMFKTVCIDAIDKASTELEKHRGWKQWLAHFASAIISILTFGYFNLNYNLGIFGLFPTKTDSKSKLDNLNKTVEHMDEFIELGCQLI
ncbi:MAG: hypothetical protein H0T84_05375 [Tatlockia sp.]|nr:hypothetical protein [Tatlockia sp.]